MKWNKLFNGPAPVGTEATCVLIDASGSMSESDWPPTRLVAAQEACLAWYQAKSSGHPQDLAGVVIFHDESLVVVPLQTVLASRNTFATAVKGIEGGGGTELVAGLATAGEMLLGEYLAPRPRGSTTGLGWLSRLVFNDVKTPPEHIPMDSPPSPPGIVNRILLLTDGHSTSEADPLKVADELKNRGVSFDVVGIGGEPHDVDEEQLRQIASANSDGSKRYRFIGEKNHLVREFVRLANRIEPM